MREAKRRQRYETWVREHGGERYAFAFRLCGNAAQAEDMVQETYYEAWRLMKTLRDPESGRAWLYPVLRFRHAHWRRDSGRRVQPGASFSQVESILAAPQESVEVALAGTDGVINFAYSNADYKVRLEPEKILAAAERAMRERTK